MLNWRIEEEDYIREKLREYKEPFLFCLFKSDKKKNENLNKYVDSARLEYRKSKLDDILLEVKKERERIDKLVNDMNSKFEDYMNKQNHIISKNIKPFRIEAKPYDNYSEPTLSQMEVVTIHGEPLKLSFIQEKLEVLDKEK